MSQRYLGGIITANPTLPTLSSASGVWTLEQDFQNSASITPQVIGRSVRLRSSASGYFNRTFGTPTNNKIWSYSLWVKRGKLGAEQELLNANSGNSQFYFSSSDTLNFYDATAGATYYSTQVFRDPSAWYHIVVSVDTTQATSGNRVRIYVNGSQITAFSTGTAPTQNNASAFNIASTVHTIGRYNPTTTNYFDGYLTEVNFIDGQALTPSSFGAYDSNGIWQPLSYRGTYGTNGFYLNFSDNSAATATTIGKDYSGNGNNWTPNNISVTAGVTYDSMIDVPTMWADGGNGRGNYAVVNPLDKDPSVTVSEGNLAHTTGASWLCSRGSFQLPSSGKWYWETTIATTTSGTVGASVGVCTAAAVLNNFNTTGQYQAQAAATGNLYSNGAQTASTLGVFTAGDIIQVAADCDNGKIWIGKNNVFWNSTGGTTGNPSGNSNETFATSPAGMFPFTATYQDTVRYNFGQRPFTYTPPTGFKALNTQNLPAVTINNGAQYMAATLWTGNQSARTIDNSVNGTSFQPDFIWTKSRSDAESHRLSDSVRGGNGTVLYTLLSNDTAAQGTDTDASGFATNGFTIRAGTNSPNVTGRTYVGWQWKAGGTAVSNTSGSITSSVSANTTAGFSVVTYTGTGANATVGHGLGVAPKMIIAKCRSTAGTYWIVGHSSLASWTNYLNLNTTTAAGSLSTVWNSTAPTASVFSLGSDDNINGSGRTNVAYCFAEVAGYSKFGSYTGNGSTDGPFLYCGFRPRFIMVKGSSNASSWQMFDTSRSTYNVVDNTLWADLSSAEGTGTARVDLLSNGFKVRAAAGTDPNVSGATYIYMAFAENPFNISRAR